MAERRADRGRESRLLGGAARRRSSPRRAARGARARWACAMSLDFPVRALSAGQKRRVALARLLVARPPAVAARRADDRARRRRARRCSPAIMREHLPTAASSSPPPTRRSGSTARKLRLARLRGRARTLALTPTSPRERGAPFSAREGPKAGWGVLPPSPFRARMARRAAHRRRRVGRRRVLPDPGHDHAVRARARPQAARPARAGDPVDRGAAGDPARARPAVPGRSRGRFARHPHQRDRCRSKSPCSSNAPRTGRRAPAAHRRRARCSG